MHKNDEGKQVTHLTEDPQILDANVQNFVN